MYERDMINKKPVRLIIETTTNRITKPKNRYVKLNFNRLLSKLSVFIFLKNKPINFAIAVNINSPNSSPNNCMRTSINTSIFITPNSTNYKYCNICLTYIDCYL